MFTACKSPYDCVQTQVNTRETHAPITSEQIKLAASLVLVSLCYRLVKHSSQLDTAVPFVVHFHSVCRATSQASHPK